MSDFVFSPSAGFYLVLPWFLFFSSGFLYFMFFARGQKPILIGGIISVFGFFMSGFILVGQL